MELVNPVAPTPRRVRGRFCRAYGAEYFIDPDAAIACARRFRVFVVERFKPIRILAEWPTAEALANGQTMRGWIDVLVETADGWVVIDHKSSPRPKSEWRTEALEHSGQLACYRSMIAATGARLAGSAWIHFPVSGGMVRVDSHPPVPGDRCLIADAMSETLSQPTPHCPNCGAPRQSDSCAACGQNSRSYLRATRESSGDVLSEVFDLDSRLGRTLRFLVLRPAICRAEFASERAPSYVSPVRLYIVVSLVFFAWCSLNDAFRVERTWPAGGAAGPPTRHRRGS
jgi:hypothetical protein